MLNRTQKKEQVAGAAEEIKNSKSLIFADFTGVGVEAVRKLKSDLREAGAKFSIVKKRLLNIALKREGVELDAMQFSGPVGTVFAPEDLTSVAAKVYKFSQEAKTFQVLGAYDFGNKSFLNSDEFMVIAKLPSREILLAQIMGGITGPLRAFMSIVKQLSERPATSSTATSDKGEGQSTMPAEGEKKEANAAVAEAKSSVVAGDAPEEEVQKDQDKVEEKQ
jgi:large subunit ribosomal protein L10